MNLRQALEVYVAHQVEVITRRSEYRLNKARDRAHILEGLLKALDMIDAIITLIRGSESADAAQARRCRLAPFEFSETQATHILDMALRRLAALERQKLRDEFDELAQTIAELEAILADDAKLRGVIKDELTAIRDKYGDDRRTEITTDPGDLADLDLIEDEELVLMLSHRGYVKTVPVDQFRTQGRGGKGVRGGNLRDEDYVEHLLTHDRALVPAVLLEPRPRVPPARARDPDEGPHRARHRARQPRRAAGRRAHRGGHRHPHLRRRRLPVLRDAQRHREEDADVGVRLVAAQRV